MTIMMARRRHGPGYQDELDESDSGLNINRRPCPRVRPTGRGHTTQRAVTSSAAALPLGPRRCDGADND